MAITSLVMLIAFSVVYLTTYNNIQTENQRKLDTAVTFPLAGSITSTLPDLSVGGDVPIIQGTGVVISASTLTPASSPSFLIQTDAEGNILHVNSFIDMPKQVYQEAADLAWQNKGRSTINLEDRLWLYSITPIQGNLTKAEYNGQSFVTVMNDYYRIAFLDITDTQRTLRDLLITFLAVGVATLVAIYWISRFFANRSIKPIAEVWEKQRQFIADASHELKTPLAIIMANYDALLANQDETIKSQKEWFDYMKAGTDRMAKLINDLLSLAKMENTDIVAAKSSFNISQVIGEVISSMEAMAKEKGLSLGQSMDPNLNLYSDLETVKKVFAILLDNAIKYSDPNSTINVVLKASKHRVLCSVQNWGKPIAKEDLPKIFDRFYRSDSSRTEESGGYGLGLAIAKMSIERLDGNISVESKPDGLTTFTFALGDVI
jgi:signal transduction histidine kinase